MNAWRPQASRRNVHAGCAAVRAPPRGGRAHGTAAQHTPAPGAPTAPRATRQQLRAATPLSLAATISNAQHTRSAVGTNRSRALVAVVTRRRVDGVEPEAANVRRCAPFPPAAKVTGVHPLAEQALARHRRPMNFYHLNHNNAAGQDSAAIGHVIRASPPRRWHRTHPQPHRGHRGRGGVSQLVSPAHRRFALRMPRPPPCL